MTAKTRTKTNILIDIIIIGSIKLSERCKADVKSNSSILAASFKQADTSPVASPAARRLTLESGISPVALIALAIKTPSPTASIIG